MWLFFLLQVQKALNEALRQINDLKSQVQKVEQRTESLNDFKQQLQKLEQEKLSLEEQNASLQQDLSHMKGTIKTELHHKEEQIKALQAK